MISFQKHLIKCRCVLPNLKANRNAPTHHFVVMSVIEEDGSVRPKIAQCNNCGLLHKITDLCVSEILQGKEESVALIKLEEIKNNVPEKISAVLESNDVDLSTWECVSFIVENKLWGNHVVLSSDVIDGEKHLKIMKIFGENMFKIETLLQQCFV